MKIYRVEFETDEEKGFSYYANLEDYDLYGIPTYKANRVDRFTGEIEAKEIYLIKKTIKSIEEIEVEFLSQEKEVDNTNKYYLCGHCIEGLRRMRQQIFVSKEIHQDSKSIDGIECSWCEHITDVVYECK